MIQTHPVVVFDIGGVLVRICQTWQEAIEVAGVASIRRDGPSIPLTDFAAFNAFQATEITEEEYLKQLADFVGVPISEAIRIHVAILREPYPGIDLVIDGLKAEHIATGCLSNTNAAHWHALTQTEQFSVIARLDYRAGSHELGCAKPDPCAFQTYIAKFGLDNRQILYFDDSRANADVARSLGWESHLIDPWGDPPAQIQAILAAERTN
jgi:HAD superfamily hydrolase (TIGR01509 family)